MVSVPLRGKGRDQFDLIPEWEQKASAFPSPCGEKVGINVQLPGPFRNPARAFPSPCGEKVGINGTE